jgi:hypothetical protein
MSENEDLSDAIKYNQMLNENYNNRAKELDELLIRIENIVQILSKDVNKLGTPKTKMCKSCTDKKEVEFVYDGKSGSFYHQ